MDGGNGFGFVALSRKPPAAISGSPSDHQLICRNLHATEAKQRWPTRILAVNSSCGARLHCCQSQVNGRDPMLGKIRQLALCDFR